LHELVLTPIQSISYTFSFMSRSRLELTNM
jgi:hypothetical protein